MNYTKIYEKLIGSRRNRLLDPTQYYEKHHIVMKSMGGTNDSENLIYLTAKEHFLAHWLLWRIHRNSQTAYAFHLMSAKSGRHYAEGKEALAHANTLHKKGKPFANGSELHRKSLKGLKKSAEHRRKIGEQSKKQKGKKLSENHRKNIGDTLRGKPLSDDHRQKMSESAKIVQKGRKYSDEEKEKRAKNVQFFECPHCNRSVKGKMNFARWHGEKCKRKQGMPGGIPITQKS